jgi:GT2 family glycosyltransferase
MQPKVVISVVICTKDRPEKLAHAVGSVLLSLAEIRAELIIVDQSSDDCSERMVRELGDSRIRYTHTRMVLSAARNLGIRLCAAELVAFTDDDCIVHPDWANALIAELRSHPMVAAVFGQTRAFAPDGRRVQYVTHSSSFGESTHAELEGSLYCHSLTVGDEQRFNNRPCSPSENVGSTNNFAARRSAFVRGGLFSVRLGSGTWIGCGEDTELVYRWLRQGLCILYSPRPLVLHSAWVSAEAERPLLARYATAAVAVFTYYAIHGDQLAWRILRFRWRGIRCSRRCSKPPTMYLREPPARAFLRGVVGGCLLALRGLGNTSP